MNKFWRSFKGSFNILALMLGNKDTRYESREALVKLTKLSKSSDRGRINMHLQGLCLSFEVDMLSECIALWWDVHARSELTLACHYEDHSQPWVEMCDQWRGDRLSERSHVTKIQISLDFFETTFCIKVILSRPENPYMETKPQKLRVHVTKTMHLHT